MIGRTISHYRILSQLGVGGMGVVYEAEDDRLRRRVALKFVPEELAHDVSAIERLRAEARTASSLNHPNICTIHDIGEHDGRPFIVMELLHGQSLRDRIALRPLKVHEAVDVGIQVADALERAHARGIIHRDVKPANLFLVDHGPVKVLDFGLAKLLPHETRNDDSSATTMNLTTTGMTVGTVAYMSPEQVRGDELDRRTDLFSLGAVLYECVTGRQPFTGKTSAVVFASILTEAPVAPLVLNPNIPARLQDVINNCLEKDRELRYQDAAGLRADLKRVRRDLESGAMSVAVTGSIAPTRPGASAEMTRPVNVFDSGGAPEDNEVTREVQPGERDSRQTSPSRSHAGSAADSARDKSAMAVIAASLTLAAAASAIGFMFLYKAPSPPPMETASVTDTTPHTVQDGVPPPSSPSAIVPSAEIAEPPAATPPDPPAPPAAAPRSRSTEPAPPPATPPRPSPAASANGGGASAAAADSPAPVQTVPGSPAVHVPPGLAPSALPAPAPPAPASSPSLPPPSAPAAASPPAAPAREPAASAPAAAAASASADASRSTAPAAMDDDSAIRRLIATYARAIETKDLDLFRTVKPNLSAEEQRRLTDGFRAVTSQQVAITIVGIERRGSDAIVRVRRRDTIVASGREQTSNAQQTFTVTQANGGWVIRDIGR